MFFRTDTNKHIYIKNIMLLIFFVKLEIPRDPAED